MKRIAILCPGRGSYTKRSLRSLPADHPWVARAEELRAEAGLGSLRELDATDAWDPARHLRPDSVSPLIYLISMLDAQEAMAAHQTVAVAGNSMGWYTALAVAGALSFDDGFRLVQRMSRLQMGPSPAARARGPEGRGEAESLPDAGGLGGQVLFPVVDEQWRPDASRRALVDEALATSAGEAMPSIDLGGYAVLAGTERGVAHLLAALPRVEIGPSVYPFRLAQHGPYHTPLLAGVAERAARELADLEFRPPGTPLIDGRGTRFTPWTTDPRELRDYTLGAQVTTPFRFTTSVRVALREHAPDLLALPGPGNTLGGVCGQILAAEGWRGIANRADFERVQEGDRPVVWSMRRS